MLIKAKEKLATKFITRIADQLDVNLGFDQSKWNSARLAVFGFADSRASTRVPISFDQNGQMNMMEAAGHVLNADGSEKNIDRWIYRYFSRPTFRWLFHLSLIVAQRLTWNWVSTPQIASSPLVLIRLNLDDSWLSQNHKNHFVDHGAIEKVQLWR